MRHDTQTVGGAKAPTPASTNPRMGLSRLVRGRVSQPRRVVVFGPEGVGKTTFAAGAPSPIFLGAEDGTAQLDVTRFAVPESWGDALDAVRVLTQEQHDFKTLVVDTVDWLEPIIWAFICKRDGEKNVESYGYGRGYQTALDEWRIFLAALERLRSSTGMHVILLAHAWIRPFKNPEGPDYDRYELKLNTKAGGLLKEWCDALLFANFETYAHKDEKSKRVRGVSTGSRLIFTERAAAYDAKNRYGLPPTIPLSWDEFESAAMAGQPADPMALEAEIRRKVALLGGELEKGALAAIERAGGNASKLAQLNSWANSKLTLEGKEN